MPDDLRDFPDPRLTEWPGEDAVVFAIDPAAVPLPETAQREPSFDAGPVMIGFDDDPQPEPEAADPGPPLLDLARAVDEPQRHTTDQDRRDWIVDLTAAAGVHLLSFLVFMYWTAAPAEIAAPIPVQLVLEEPAPPYQPKPETKPPPGRLASTAMGDPQAKPAKPPPEAPAEQPKKTTAAATVPPPRRPPPELVSALPKPAMSAAELKLPKPFVKPAALEPSAATKTPLKHEAAARPASHPSPERPWGSVPGPAATEDEYLAYANALIRRNQELILPSLLQGRSGSAVINILVLADGTIASIAIKEGSGYPEIDRRAEQMVAAVKRFPPLPQWFHGEAITLSYHMLFGDRMVLP